MHHKIKRLKQLVFEWYKLFFGLAVSLIFGITGTYLLVTSHAATKQAAGSSSTISWQPVYATNFADPTVLSYNGKYYGFATETSHDHITSAISSDQLHWTSSADALPNLPSWATSGQDWAPSVAYDASSRTFVMFYAILDKQFSPAKHCIGKAVSSSPSGPFVDTSSAPFLCQPTLGGTNDPQIFFDSDGRAYLYVKNAGDAGGTADVLWVQPLSSSLTPQGSLIQLLTTDQSWQGQTVEGPGMVKLGGKYFLLYAGNSWNSSRYAIGYATCNSPIGPCTDNPSNPFIASQGSMLGPGSPAFYVDNSGQQQMVFAAWYNSVGSFRAMYAATLALVNGQPTVVASPPISDPPPPPPTPSPTPSPSPSPTPNSTPSTGIVPLGEGDTSASGSTKNTLNTTSPNTTGKPEQTSLGSKRQSSLASKTKTQTPPSKLARVVKVFGGIVLMAGIVALALVAYTRLKSSRR